MQHIQEPFYGVPRSVAYCQQERTEELSRRMRDRNVPSAPLQPQMCARPVLTKYAVMPILDQRKEATVPLATYPVYNPEHVFNPGSAVAPWSGYATAVNTESTLRNQFSRCKSAGNPNTCRRPRATFTTCALTRVRLSKRTRSYLKQRSLHP